MSAALRRVAEDTKVPPIDPDRERALLLAFDDAQAAPKAGRWRPWVWAPVLAAALLMAAVMGWRAPASAPVEQATKAESRPRDLTLPSAALTPRGNDAVPTEHRFVAGVTRQLRSRSIDRREDPQEATLENVSFVTWPGAAAGPPLESGSLMRVDLPVSILPALGLWPPASAQSTVPVEILVGQDGFARAFRLVAE